MQKRFSFELSLFETAGQWRHETESKQNPNQHRSGWDNLQNHMTRGSEWNGLFIWGNSVLFRRNAGSDGPGSAH